MLIMIERLYVCCFVESRLVLTLPRRACGRWSRPDRLPVRRCVFDLLTLKCADRTELADMIVF